MQLGGKPRARRAAGLLCAASIAFALGACGDDGDGGTFALTGIVQSLDDDKPLARVTVTARSGKSTTTDDSGRFTLRAKEGESIEMQASGLAPIAKRATRAPVGARMKPYDARGTLAPATGGVIRSQGLHAAANFRPGVLSGSSETEVVLAALDPRKSGSLSAVTGDFTAKRGAVSGRISVASPMYVQASDPQRGKLNDGSKVEVDFPAWSSASQAGLALFAFDDASGDWTEVGTVTTTTNADGVAVYRGEADRLGWLAVGEFFTELTCVKGCVNDSDASPVRNGRVTATGLDHFAQTVVATDNRGCFELQVRANAEVQLDIATSSASLYQQTVETGSGQAVNDVGQATRGGACQDLGTIGATNKPNPATGTIEDLADHLISCGYTGRDGLLRTLRSDLDLDDDPDGIIYPAGERNLWAQAVPKYVACALAAPCSEVTSIYCDSDLNDDGADTPYDDDPSTDSEFDRCMERVDEEVDAYDDMRLQNFRCGDGSRLQDAYEICDGYEECEDGSDEARNACAMTEHILCSGVPSPSHWRCDGSEDCPNGEDEQGCFDCGDGDHVPPSYRCDGYEDCSNGADEEGCGTPFSCPTGTSVDRATAGPSRSDGDMDQLKKRLKRARKRRH